jgi:diguanylate cyclase (GGDEF)-like protein
MELSHLAFTIQVLAIPPVAVLLLLLARAVPRRFLTYWAVGWAILAAALFALRVSISVPEGSVAARIGLCLYCCLGYVSGFMIWAGCRELASGRRIVPADAWVLGPAILFGLVIPWVVSGREYLYPFHVVIFGGFFLLGLAATRGYQSDSAHPHLGIHVVRACLLILGVLFLHYGPVTYYTAYVTGEPFQYLLISPMYDALAEVGLALGMAVVAVERVQHKLERANRELAETNHRLAQASEQLTIAARTDPLTGLLNRRAFDAMRADRAGGPFAGSVGAVDLNHLKRINDAHGHAAGDAAIQLVGRALRGHFRITDPVFRLGGDEFLVVMESGRAAELAGRLEGVDAALRGLRLPGTAEPLDLVIAWGIADFDGPGEFDRAVDQADQAMYACKTRRKDTPAATP